jgi:hypothetical protein
LVVNFYQQKEFEISWRLGQLFSRSRPDTYSERGRAEERLRHLIGRAEPSVFSRQGVLEIRVTAEQRAGLPTNISSAARARFALGLGHAQADKRRM